MKKEEILEMVAVMLTPAQKKTISIEVEQRIKILGSFGTWDKNNNFEINFILCSNLRDILVYLIPHINNFVFLFQFFFCVNDQKHIQSISINRVSYLNYQMQSFLFELITNYLSKHFNYQLFFFRNLKYHTIVSGKKREKMIVKVHFNKQLMIIQI